jgi:hypothetical protein
MASADVTEDIDQADEDRAPRSARWLVGVLFALLLVPGLIGFDAWPMTGWRLFSASRHATDTRWIVQRVGAGDAITVDLNDLPLGFSNAEWPMAEHPHRHQAICEAMAEAVGHRWPDTREVRLAKDHEKMVHQGGEWVVTHDVEVQVTCAVRRSS